MHQASGGAARVTAGAPGTASGAAAEAPRILETLGVITGGPYYDQVGLEIHSVSMVILAAFVGFRIYRFWRGSAS